MSRYDYCVLTSSGWAGARWWLDSWHENRASAEARATEIQQPDARNDNYRVAVAGRTSLCDLHTDSFCYRVTLDGHRLHVMQPVPVDDGFDW